MEGLLSFLYTGACSLSPDQDDTLNILQVSVLLSYLFAFCPRFAFVLLSFCFCPIVFLLSVFVTASSRNLNKKIQSKLSNLNDQVEGFPPKVGSKVQTEASLNRDVKEEVLFSELKEQFQNCETAPEPEEGECVNRFNDSEGADGDDDEWKPDLKLVIQGNKAKTKVVPRLEEQRKLFDKEVNIEVLLKQINTDPEMSLKQMELSGIPVYHYPCDHCGQSCPELQQYAEHVKTEHPEKVAMFDQRYRTYQCLHCKMCFLSRKERRTHVGKLHKSASQADSVRSHRVFVCPHCKVEWKSAKNTKKLEAFLEHLIRHKLGPKGLWCAYCPDKFDTFNTLRRHVSATHLSSRTVCPQCGEICRDNHALKKHNQKAHVIKEDSPKKKEEIHVCDLCAKQFPSYGKLWYHKSSAHKDPSKYLTCEVCGKKLIDKSRFEVHMTLHKPPSIACPHCGRLFHTDRYLDRHIKSQHTSASKLSFNCDQCGKGFYSSQKLSDHMNVHMGVKPYAHIRLQMRRRLHLIEKVSRYCTRQRGSWR